MTDYTSRFIPLWWDNILWWDILNHDQICKINIHWRIKGIYNWKTSITLILSWDVIWVDFKKTMIYNWIKLQNEYEYALAPQYGLANCDDYITSNLLGIAIIWVHFRVFGGVCVAYLFIFLWCLFCWAFFMFVFALCFVPNVVCNCELSIPDFFKDCMVRNFTVC